MMSARLPLLSALFGVLASAVTISHPSGDLVITGVGDGKAVATYKNSLWITASEPVSALSIVPMPLEGPGGPIPVGAIHLNPNPIALDANISKELQVSWIRRSSMAISRAVWQCRPKAL